MKISKFKSKTAAIAIILLMISAFVVMVNVSVQSQTYQPAGSQPLPSGVTADLTLDTISYLSFRPNPVGSGQNILVNIWLQPPIDNSRYLTGLEVTITDPNGDKDVIGPIDTYHGDSTAWFEYPVNEVGDWKIKFDFPGGYYPAGDYVDVRRGGSKTFDESVYYKPSTSGEKTLTVQDEPVLSWPPAELPTDYWTRPIPIENREWWEIGGNFPFTGLGGGPGWPAETNTYSTADYDFIPYVQGPNTAHIVWRRQGALAGIIGGQFGYRSYGAGEGTYAGVPSIIFQGRCYDTITKMVDGEPTRVWQCYDLRTGEVYWERIGVPEPTTLVYNRLGPSAPGAGETGRGKGGSWGFVHLTYIGGGRMIKYDPWSGNVVKNVSIAPLTSGTVYREPYVLSVQNLGGGQYRLINWTTTDYDELGNSLTMDERVMNNVTWPWRNLGDTQDFETGIAIDAYGFTDPATGVSINVGISAANMRAGGEMWDITADIGFGYFSTSTAVADHGKFALRFNDGKWRCYDQYNGNYVWTSGEEEWPWGAFGAYSVATAYGLIYDFSYAGIYALDWDDGSIEWHYYPGDPGYEAAFSSYPFFTNSYVADGKIYIANGEHSPTQPLMRGWRLHCIDATTGKGLWNISGGGSVGPIADGYLTFDSRYDGHMYVFGKGKSETTVTAPDAAVPKGTAITIKGSVLDMSPAQPGTPCVSAESMATYMEYLHMQKPIPDGYTVTGVPVMLLALDADDNVIEIGTTTTDMSGKFAYAWTPPDQGLYKITATFLGDDSYGSSWDETAVTVGPALEEVNLEPIEGSTSNVEESVSSLTTYVIVILVIVIIALVIALYSAFKPR
ncbi:MAG: PQQ-binding-like beta-propeller repeat protein [Candidatus Bathyarchaeum sp.]|nr:MAG: PQQ-binding-like beta-propeller repeat protein [Candidatus Bathyarchaeum sp.]